MYEEKIINSIKEKSKNIKKTISVNEAEEIIKGDTQEKKLTKNFDKKKEYQKAKKSKKSSKKMKKIRKK